MAKIAKPTWDERREFNAWLVEKGFETDRDQTRFTFEGNDANLELWYSACANGEFKCLNARINLKFASSIYYGGRSGYFNFAPCRVLSREYVDECLGTLDKVQKLSEFFFDSTKAAVEKVDPKKFIVKMEEK